MLGLIYNEGKYIVRDLNKAIYYFKKGAILKDSESQFQLGIIYLYDIQQINNDTIIDEVIYYLTLASNQNHQMAQYVLGCLYSLGKYTCTDYLKGIDLLQRSISNGYTNANFEVGFFYHEGKYVERDIKKAIYHYKEASNVNNQYAKNNLGVICKNGIENEHEQYLGTAEEYFNEAIRLKNDMLSIYNLSHMYIYQFDDKIEDAIKLLLKLLDYNISHFNKLLCIALIKHIGFDKEKIHEYLSDKTRYADRIYSYISSEFYVEPKGDNLKKYFEEYKTIDFFYTNSFEGIQSNQLYNHDVKQYKDDNTRKNITNDFYEGFG